MFEASHDFVSVKRSYSSCLVLRFLKWSPKFLWNCILGQRTVAGILINNVLTCKVCLTVSRDVRFSLCFTILLCKQSYRFSKGQSKSAQVRAPYQFTLCMYLVQKENNWASVTFKPKTSNLQFEEKIFTNTPKTKLQVHNIILYMYYTAQIQCILFGPLIPYIYKRRKAYKNIAIHTSGAVHTQFRRK